MRPILKQRTRLLVSLIILFLWTGLDIAAQTSDNGGGDGDGSSGADGRSYVEVYVDAHQCSSDDWARFSLNDGQNWTPNIHGDNCAQGAAGTGTFQLKRGEKYTLRAIPKKAVNPADGDVSLGWTLRTDDPSVSITGTASASVWQNPMQEEVYEVIIPKVEVISADVTQDTIELRLTPPEVTGTLTLELTDPDSHVIRNEERTGSTDSIQETFDMNNLAAGEYHKIKASWDVNGAIVENEFDYHIRVLGMYHHTRYNTPTESHCTGASIDFDYTEGECQAIQQCSWSEGNGLSEWLEEVAENGSGYSNSGEYFSLEWYCSGSSATYRLRNVPGPCPQCGGTLTSGVSVARNKDNQHLPCGARVFVHEVGIVTVEDAGGGLGMEQLDHYDGTTGCDATAGTIGDLMTIRLYDE